MKKLAEYRGTDLIKVINHETKERHEAENLEGDEEVVLVGHTPDHSPLLLTDPPVSHGLLDGVASYDGQEGHEQGQGPGCQAEC